MEAQQGLQEVFSQLAAWHAGTAAGVVHSLLLE